MAAILNEHEDFGAFLREYYVGIQETFVKISAFYIFSRLSRNAPRL